MAYTTIDDPTIFFNTITWSGVDGSDRALTGVGFQPDWVWSKARTDAYSHVLFDAVRGAGSNKELYSDLTQSEGGTGSTASNGFISSFDSDGFSTDNGSANTNLYFNASGKTYVAWNWLAGGTAPSQTYSVKVVSDSGNKYRFDDFGTSAVTLDLQEGGTYTFDQSDSSNSGHPLRFSTTSNGTHGGGSEYTTGVTTTGTPGSAGAKTVITVAASAPTLYYYCTQHSGMGGQANTNSTFGSSNFSGSIQANVSANTTAGFSIVSYTGNATSGATVGHGLGVTPDMLVVKNRDNASYAFTVYHKSTGNSGAMFWATTDAFGDYNGAGYLRNPNSSTFETYFTSNGNAINASGDKYITYCFAEKKGYSKFGSYTGNGNADGTFIYTGFKPAFVIVKNTVTAPTDWIMIDNKRPGYNLGLPIQPNLSNAEGSSDTADLLSNGFKVRNQYGGWNGAVKTIYMAFAENPFVTSTGIPTTAR